MSRTTSNHRRAKAWAVRFERRGLYPGPCALVPLVERQVRAQVFVTPARGAERFQCIGYGLPAPEICENCEQLKRVLTVLCLTEMG